MGFSSSTLSDWKRPRLPIIQLWLEQSTGLLVKSSVQDLPWRWCAGETGRRAADACGPHAGRPRVEDRYGEEFVDFMRTYVNTRGRMLLPDSTRMSDTFSSF